MALAADLKHNLKIVRWRLRRARAASQWGSAALARSPVVFGNAMPKSGSHLIAQVLQGLPRLGPFVNPGFPPVNRDEDNRKLSSAQILRNIRGMQPGDIGYGYVSARQENIEALTAPGRATVFVHRDPRDVIVSHVFYATDMHPGHGMHEYYTTQLGSMEARINAAIQGVELPGAELSSIRAKYDDYLGWLDQPAVLCLRFEDLVLQRQAALNRLLNYLEARGFRPELDRSRAVAVLEAAIAPHRSGTFRKGRPGGWREHFTPANKTFFKAAAGDLLVRLGYEQDADW